MSKFIATSSHYSSIEPLQPQLSREKPQKVINGGQKLLVNVEKVNLLSEQLEAALFELKVTASEIKCDQNAPPISNKIFKYKLIAIPHIHYKRPGLIVVTTRKIDLFGQEREAIQVAQMLRQRTKRRLNRPIPSNLLKSSGCQRKNFVRQLILTWQKLIGGIGRKSTVRNRSTTANKAISC